MMYSVSVSGGMRHRPPTLNPMSVFVRRRYRITSAVVERWAATSRTVSGELGRIGALIAGAYFWSRRLGRSGGSSRLFDVRRAARWLDLRLSQLLQPRRSIHAQRIVQGSGRAALTRRPSEKRTPATRCLARLRDSDIALASGFSSVCVCDLRDM